MENDMISNSKQVWEVGNAVKVGFLTLIICAKIATPGDYFPDAYAMTNAAGTSFYRFVPHNGLTKCDSLADAMAVYA
jgi:hypothetical protein